MVIKHFIFFCTELVSIIFFFWGMVFVFLWSFNLTSVNNINERKLSLSSIVCILLFSSFVYIFSLRHSDNQIIVMIFTIGNLQHNEGFMREKKNFEANMTNVVSFKRNRSRFYAHKRYTDLLFYTVMIS